MARLTAAERFLLRFFVLGLILFTTFIISYWDFFVSVGVVYPLFLVPAITLSVGFAHLGLRWFSQSRTMVTSSEVRFKKSSLNWGDMTLVEYVRLRSGGVFLALHSPKAAVQIPLREVELLEGDLVEHAPKNLCSTLFPIPRQSERVSTEEQLYQSARAMLLPMVLFSLSWSVLIWQIALMWALIFSAMSLLIPYFWVESLRLLLLLFSRSVQPKIALVSQGLAYGYGALYLWYGIFFLSNVLS